MCDPLSIIGGIASLGGTAMNAAADAKVTAARNDALAAERIRQREFNQEADAINEVSQDRYKKFGKKRDDKANALGKYYNKQEVAEPASETALPTTTSALTVQEEAKQRGQATDMTNRSGEALGQLRAFGDLLGSKSLAQSQDASQVGQIASYKEGSSNVLPMELEAANSKGQGLRMFADIVGGLGGLALSKGLSTPGSAVTAASPFKASTTLGGFLGNSSMPAARALDRASVPGYAGLSNLYGVH